MTPQGLTVLVADDGVDILHLLEFHLSREGFQPILARNGREALDRFHEGAPDLALIDIMMPELNGIDVLKKIRDESPDFPVIIMTADTRIPRVVEAVKHGAYDFLEKPFDINLLRVTLRQVAEHVRLQRRLHALRLQVGTDDAGFSQIVAESPKMKSVLRQLRSGINSNATLLLLGESGTGKGMLAREVHRRGPRRNGPFMAVNCAAIPENLLESELFGHEKGAFTGATATHIGYFEAANGGVVFLDEIGDMPLHLQAKLLRVLQEREIVRLGSNRPIPLDVRVIAATNSDLHAAIAAGKFREDLYYRIAVLEIVVPSLRERRDDIPVFIEHFIARANEQENKSVRSMSDEARDVLLNYDFPGNVRQLESYIRQAVINAETDTITTADLHPELIAHRLPRIAKQAALGRVVSQPAPAPAGANLASGDGVAVANGAVILNFSDEQTIPELRHVEEAVIERAIDVCGGNMTRAAQRLNIGRATIYRRVHGVSTEGGKTTRKGPTSTRSTTREKRGASPSTDAEPESVD